MSQIAIAPSAPAVGALLRDWRRRRRLSQLALALDAEISARVSSQGGVNLDEELSNLILYQRAYGANARVIRAVDELWQTLLNVI